MIIDLRILRSSHTLHTTHSNNFSPLNLHLSSHVTVVDLDSIIPNGEPGTQGILYCMLFFVQTWNATCHTLTAASAPIAASLPPRASWSALARSSQRTALTPPGTAFRMAIFLTGLRTLQT